MINPAPVPAKTSPYSSASAAGLPRTLETPLKSTRKRRWRRTVLWSVLGLFVAGSTFLAVRWDHIRSTTFVDHQGEKSGILSYDPSNKKSQLDYAAFKKVGQGRFNLVIAGAGGEGHTAPWLTDSIKLVSIDTLNKKATITSIPRDLYYDNAKINSVYEVAEQQQKGSGGLALREAVGDVLGVPASNFILIDFSGAKEVVDALGGIEVNVPESVYDPSFPADTGNGYKPFSIKAGPQKMDGYTALRYSRTRKADSDYKRQERQNLVLQAIKDKALSAGVLTNPVKLNNLITALGDHIRTDLEPGDIKSLVGIVKDIPNGSIATYVLDTSPSLGLLTSSSNTAAGFISYPVLGVKDFSAVHRWFQKTSPDPLLAREAPSVSVVGVPGTTAKQLQAFVDTLTDYGYAATVSTASAPKNAKTTQLYARSKDAKPVSFNYLSDFLSVAADSGLPLGSDSDFEIVYSPSAKR